MAGQKLIEQAVERQAAAGNALTHGFPQCHRVHSGFHAHGERLSKCAGDRIARHVVHELGYRRGADRPDIGRAIAHRVEHGLVPVKCGFVATNPDRHLARRSTRRPAAHRRIEHMRALGGKGLVNFLHDALRVCRQIEIGSPRSYAFDQAIGPERDALDIRRFRQRGEDHVGLLGQCARRVRPLGARLQMMARRLPVQVVHHDLVSGLEDVGGHLATHGAEPDEADNNVAGHRHSPLLSSTSTV